MAQVLTAKLMPECSDSGKESYEIQWTVKRYADVRRSESFVECQEAMFETASSQSSWFKTRWIVGLKFPLFTTTSIRNAEVYCKLLWIKGTQSTEVEAKLQTQKLLIDGKTVSSSCTERGMQRVKLLQTLQDTHSSVVGECLKIRLSSDDVDVYACSRDRERESVNLHPSGNVCFTLKLTLKKPEMIASEYDCYKLNQFSKVSKDLLCRDQVSLLYDHSDNADLKFVTSDGVEIPAHKTILRARCPVFATMLNCDLSENATGIVQMTDITGKTMKIILHYFYVGELLPSWRDPGNIVEFTYAAGKYQMTEVLELLDDLLGRNSGGDASNLDVQLINLAGKLELVNAEKRLLDRIVAKIKTVTTGELFRLFGFEEEKIAEMAEMLATEQVGESRILKLLDSLCGTEDCVDLSKKGMSLLAFARKEELKTVEKNLLKSFTEKAELVKNADELFEWFGRGKRMGK